MRQVEGVEIAAIDTHALAAEHLRRTQQIGGRLILHDFSNAFVHIGLGDLVGSRVDHQIIERPLKTETTTLPCLVEGLSVLLRRGAQGRPVGHLNARTKRPHHLAVARAKGGVLGLDFGLVVRIERRVMGRDGIVGGALKDHQLTGLLRNDRDRLDGR